MEKLFNKREFEIPDGYEARIDGNKVIVERKESEDDRIRRKIITTVHLYYGEPLEDEAKEMIAWLEKQKCEPMSELDDVVKCLINGMKFYYEDNKEATWGTDKWSMPVKHIIEVLEKQGGQKPAEWSNTDLISLDYLADFVDKNGDEFYGKNKPNVVKWIRSFANLTTQEQEWSEEDEKILSDIIEDFVHPWNEYIPDRIENEIKWLKNRLKSIRPQNHWKPSDKQMEALESATENCAYSEYQDCLRELIGQLKKLREE